MPSVFMSPRDLGAFLHNLHPKLVRTAEGSSAGVCQQRQGSLPTMPVCAVPQAMLTFGFRGAEHRQRQHDVGVGVPGGLATEEAAVVARVAPADVRVVLHAVDAQHCGGDVGESQLQDGHRGSDHAAGHPRFGVSGKGSAGAAASPSYSLMLGVTTPTGLR